MAKDNDELFFCEKCMTPKQLMYFYTTEKSDTKIYPVCKSCLTMHVNNFQEDTFIDILKDIDVPYVPQEWNSLLSKIKDPRKLTGSSILGRYLSKMKLNQYKGKTWEDSETLTEEYSDKLREALAYKGTDPETIEQIVAASKKIIPMPEDLKNAKIPKKPMEIPDFILPKETESSVAPIEMPPTVDSPAIPEFVAEIAPVMPEVDLGLTKEDITYLSLKWGSDYKQEEWVWLEQLYNDMMASYDIHIAGHLDTLKLVCKASLKCNQLIDIGDIEGFSKASRAYNELMKNGNFTALQNKNLQGQNIDSLSEVVLLAEEKGFVTTFYVDSPNDKVDYVIMDNERYLRELVTNEMGLANLIDKAVQDIKEDKEKEKTNEEDLLSEEEQLFADLYEEKAFSTEDYEEFQEAQEEMREIDKETMRKEKEE